MPWYLWVYVIYYYYFDNIKRYYNALLTVQPNQYVFTEL